MSAGVVVVGSMDDTLANHLTRALTAHQQWCRTNGILVPDALNALLLGLSARPGQERTSVGVAEGNGDGGRMLLALDFADAGTRLGVSERTVRRLVATGQLLAVSIAGCRRVRVADLNTYVESLEG